MTSPRHCGAARFLPPPSASWTRKPTFTSRTGGTAPCRAGGIHTSTWTTSTCAATGAESTKMLLFWRKSPWMKTVFVRLWAPPRGWGRTSPVGSVSSSGCADADWTAWSSSSATSAWGCCQGISWQVTLIFKQRILSIYTSKESQQMPYLFDGIRRFIHGRKFVMVMEKERGGIHAYMICRAFAET